MFLTRKAADMQITEAKCPECGGALAIPDGAEWLTCQFCGMTVHVSYNRQQTGVESDGTIRDRGTGYGLFRARVAQGWSVSGTALQRLGTSSRPYIPQIELRDRAGGVIRARLGDAGTRQSAGMKALTGMYNAHLAGVDTANYAEMPDPLIVADMAAAEVASGMGASGLSFAKQLACPDLEERRQAAFARVQRIAQAQGGMVSNPLVGVVLRTYETTFEGQPWKMACFVQLDAAKDGSGLGEGFGAGMMEGFGDLMGSIGDSLGGLFGGQQGGTQRQDSGQTQAQSQVGGAMDFLLGGGLLGKMKRERQAAQAQQVQSGQQPFAQPGFQQNFPGQQGQAAQPAAQPTQAQAQQALSQGVPWCSPEFTQYASGGTIYWYVNAIVTFAAPAADYDAQFESAFLPFVDSLEVHPDVENLSMQVVQQEVAMIRGATQTQLSQNQAAFNAQQAAHRQQQAAFDSYNQSISASRDARHQQFMASSQQQFNHSAPDFSEAIRGVNTYTTSDGREVELSVHADHAWENQAGDVIGTSGSFDPGASWTEIPRT